MALLLFMAVFYLLFNLLFCLGFFNLFKSLMVIITDYLLYLLNLILPCHMCFGLKSNSMVNQENIKEVIFLEMLVLIFKNQNLLKDFFLLEYILADFHLREHYHLNHWHSNWNLLVKMLVIITITYHSSFSFQYWIRWIFDYYFSCSKYLCLCLFLAFYFILEYYSLTANFI